MILVDNNLSYRLATHLKPAFAGSIHVANFNMDQNTEDIAIWNFAKEKGYTILTKDNDFETLSRLLGCPPKVVQMTCGNKTTAEIISILEKSCTAIQLFINDTENCLLYLQ